MDNSIKWTKKGTLKTQKSKISILVLNQSSISAVFLKVQKNRTNQGMYFVLNNKKKVPIIIFIFLDDVKPKNKNVDVNVKQPGNQIRVPKRKKNRKKAEDDVIPGT